MLVMYTCLCGIELFYSVVTTDFNPPVVSNCPQPITMTIQLGTPSSTATWIEPTATDDCGVPTVLQSHRPGDDFPVGVTQVTYMFTDSSGNQETCTFTVTGNLTLFIPQAAALKGNVLSKKQKLLKQYL